MSIAIVVDVVVAVVVGPLHLPNWTSSVPILIPTILWSSTISAFDNLIFTIKGKINCDYVKSIIRTYHYDYHDVEILNDFLVNDSAAICFLNCADYENSNDDYWIDQGDHELFLETRYATSLCYCDNAASFVHYFQFCVFLCFCLKLLIELAMPITQLGRKEKNKCTFVHDIYF